MDIPRLSTYTDRLAREKQANQFLNYVIGRAADTVKAVVLPQTQSSTGGSLREQGVAFAELLARQTLLGRLAASAIPAPVYSRLVGVDDAGRGSVVGESQPVPVAKLGFDGPTLEPSKIATIIPLSRELVRSNDARAQSLIAAVVTRNLRLAQDELLLDAQAAVSNTRPAGLLHNVVAASGGSPESLPDDISALWAAVRQGESDRPVFITSGRAPAYLALVKDGLGAAFPGVRAVGGSLLGVPLLTSSRSWQPIDLDRCRTTWLWR